MAKNVWAIVTGEYPPRAGGVSDYTYLVAKGLAEAGDEVHVWTPGANDPPPSLPGVTVHLLCGAFGMRSLTQLSLELRRLPSGFRLLIQYVPQALGWRGMNVPFALWVRSRRKQHVELMFHEVMYPIRRGQPLKHNVLGLVTKLMAKLLARAATRLYVSVPNWAHLLHDLAPNLEPVWLPVPSNVSSEIDVDRVSEIRARYASHDNPSLIGHFGTYGGMVAEMLRRMLPDLMARDPGAIVMLIGRGSTEFARDLISTEPSLGHRIVSVGGLSSPEVSAHLATCDLLLQPYIDGVSTRRGSTMAGLALGLPIVTTTGPATEPIWRETGAVELAPADDLRAVVDVTTSLLQNPERRRNLSIRAKQLYDSRFDVRRTIEVLRREKADAHSLAIAKRVAVVFLINGDHASAMGQRAREFGSRLRPRFSIEYVYRTGSKVRSAVAMFKSLMRSKPQIIYVLDIGYSGIAAGLAYRYFARNRRRLIVDTGDAIYELSKSIGRGRVGRALTWLLEKAALRGADRIVVRGSNHREMLKRQGIEAEFIPDGVDPDQCATRDSTQLRDSLGWKDQLVVGVLGNSIWSERLQMCYGWELVELLRILKEEPVRGVIIGGGSGIDHLRAKCREYGIEDKLHFAGHVPYDDLPKWLCAIDVCLSTQTNDIPGQVRTTGKLPLYLAAGRFVLASRVGEAARVLPADMLVEYDGIKDEQYPQRLADRIRDLKSSRESFASPLSVDIARAHFAYDVLADRVRGLIEELVGRGNDATHSS